MKRNRFFWGFFVGLVVAGVSVLAFVDINPVSSQKETSPDSDIKTLLQAFVDDYRSDPLAGTPTEFGIRVQGATPEDWSVLVAGASEDGREVEVALSEGFPTEPSYYFVTDLETVKKIHDGELGSLTAMGKALSTDFAPLDVEAMEGFQPNAEFGDFVPRLSFHFWTRGFPEIIRFGDKSYTREIHGGNAVLFYYQTGFRSGWFQVEPGQHVNKEESMQTNPFPSMIVVTRGVLNSRIGGKEIELHEGETIYIGPEVSHEFWNDGSKPAEGVLLMFGDGA